MNAQFHISREPWGDRTTIYFRMDTPGGVPMSAKPVEMETHKEGERMNGPMLTLDGREQDAAMQSLMDELWKAGIRPKDIGTPGHLAATQARLADFRALVSKALDVKLP